MNDCNDVMTQRERWQYCLRRRRDLEVQLKDAEIIVGLMKGYMLEADHIIAEIRAQGVSFKDSQMGITPETASIS